jgi:hypothetical protein
MSGFSRRNVIGALALVIPPDVETGADTRLAALIAEYRRLDDRIEASGNACEALDRAKGRVANAIINLPAASFVGAAYKLVLWRREAAMSFPNDFDAAHESFTFSAYQDLLRLTGLTAHAHRFDAETAARMRTYWRSPSSAMHPASTVPSVEP